MSQHVSEQLARGFAWQAFSSVGIKTVSLANILLVLHSLSTYDYGLVEIVLSAVSIASLLFLPGLAPTIVADMSLKYGLGKKAEAAGIFHLYVSLLATGAVIAWCTLFFGSKIVAHLMSNNFIHLFLKIAACSLLLGPLRIIQTTLTSYELDFKKQFLFTFTEECMRFGAVALFVYYLRWGPEGLLYAIVCAQVAALIVFFIPICAALKRLHSEGVERLPVSTLFKGHRMWSIAMSSIGGVGQQSRIWLIKLFLGTEAVGIFAFAFGIYAHLSGLVSLSGVIGPLAARFRSSQKSFSEVYYTAIKFQVVLSVVTALGAIIVLPIFIATLFPHFTGATLLTIGFAAMLPVNGLLMLYSPLFFALQEQKTAFQNAILKTVIGVALGILLYPLLGMPGVLLEVWLTHCILAAERTRRFIQLSHIEPMTYSQWKHFSEIDLLVYTQLKNVVARNVPWIGKGR
jgi:O-antigen/teichoic acid export membrane protein